MGDAALEMLKIEDVCLSYARDSSRSSILKGGSGEDGSSTLQVLDRINLTLVRGEFLAVVGPSGCGKSTLIGVIGGFIKPDSGRVLFNGREIAGPAADRIVVFQDDRQLFPWKTLLQNVIFPLKIKEGLTGEEMEAAAREYLKLVRLADFSSYYPHQLSGGMKQRGALARALVTEPEIMLMDEPFGSLDSQTRAALQVMLLDIWQETGGTVVFVTHDIGEAVLLADRIVVMGTNPGRIKGVVVDKLKRPRRVSDPDFSSLYDEIYQLLTYSTR